MLQFDKGGFHVDPVKPLCLQRQKCSVQHTILKVMPQKITEIPTKNGKNLAKLFPPTEMRLIKYGCLRRKRNMGLWSRGRSSLEG